MVQCVLRSFYLVVYDFYDFAAFIYGPVLPIKFLAKLLAQGHSTRQGAVTHVALAWGGSLPASVLAVPRLPQGCFCLARVFRIISIAFQLLCSRACSFGFNTAVSCSRAY